jgi:hypothetical protein
MQIKAQKSGLTYSLTINGGVGLDVKLTGPKIMWMHRCFVDLKSEYSFNFTLKPNTFIDFA